MNNLSMSRYMHNTHQVLTWPGLKTPGPVPGLSPVLREIPVHPFTRILMLIIRVTLKLTLFLVVTLSNTSLRCKTPHLMFFLSLGEIERFVIEKHRPDFNPNANPNPNPNLNYIRTLIVTRIQISTQSNIQLNCKI